MPSLKKIVVKDFRNIAFQEIRFSSKLNCISGNNGEGKTNLLDAIHYLSMTKSAFPTPDRFNWRYGTQGFTLSGTYSMENGIQEQFSLQSSEEGKKLSRGLKPIQRMSEHIGTLPLVMVSPGDTALVSDSGEERRRLANSVLSQMDREYLAAVQAYRRLLVQRNALLKDFSLDEGLLDVIDGKMEPYAAIITAARSKWAQDLKDVVSSYYRLISGGREEVSISYRGDDAPLSAVLRECRAKDRALGYTSAGPQRDDFLLTMEGHPIRRAGSQGQQKSYLVALKFALYSIMSEAYGFPPMLLLDDVFDKLDLERIANLIEMVAGKDFGQIFITDTDSTRLSSIIDRITEERAYFDCKGGEFHGKE